MDERHYDTKKLNKWFAIASVVLLASVGLMFMNDYDRKWKDYQAEFRALEVENARVKYDKEVNELEAQEEYAQAQEELKKAQEQFAAQCNSFHEVEAEIAELKAENEIINQQYKFSKAEVDVTKYTYEAVKAHAGHGVEAKKQAYEAAVAKTADLNLKLEDSNRRLNDRNKVIKDCGEQLRSVEKKTITLERQKNLIERKLESIDPAEMGVANRIANVVRDLPVLDLANPNNKVEQIVVKDIRDDVNFMTVPKVDRCMTCHLGITNPDYENAVQPFKTHPNLELYLGKNSAHPVEEFGCTSCHAGRGRSTDFSGAAHTPRNAAQKKEWEDKYGYEKIELWLEPMYPLQYTEAGCFKCHSGEGTIKGAEKLNLGLQVIEKAGCYNCHVIDRYEDWPKSGPDLTQIASKLDKTFAYKWIESPKSFRHNTWMPQYWDQSNNNDPESLKRGYNEIHSIVHYLFAKSKDFKSDEMKLKGDPVRGEEIVASVGCFACHQVQSKPVDMLTTKDSIRRDFGPNLVGLGNKTSRDWLYTWLKNPDRYHPETRMPNMRLSDQEAADVTEYLVQNTNEEFVAKKVPPVDVAQVDKITFGFLNKQEPTVVAKKKLEAMTMDEKLMFSGQKLIGQYGCYSCHNIEGFENAKPIGIELTEEGSKNIHNLDFGFVHIDHTKHAWFAQKLRDPRIFDQGKEKRPDEKLMMPNFYLSEEEIEAAVTAILGFTKINTVESKISPRTPENLMRERGEMFVKQMNCRSCHVIDGDGGTVQDTVKDWLIKYEEQTENDAEKVKESFSPPTLYGVGKKLNPQWLFNFLHKPEQKIRPWLSVRMPTYGFNSGHLNLLIKYFQNISGEDFTFDLESDKSLTPKEFEAAEKLFSEDYLGCTQCHVVGNKLPTGSKDSWAPNLGLAKTRLQPEWLIDWLKNPSEVVPGTKMPTFWDPEDYENSGAPDILDGNEDEQIRVLRNYLLQLTEDDQQAAPKAKAIPSAKPTKALPAAPAVSGAEPSQNNNPTPAQ